MLTDFTEMIPRCIGIKVQRKSQRVQGMSTKYFASPLPQY